MVRVSASCRLQQRTVLPAKLIEEEPVALVTLSLPVLYNLQADAQTIGGHGRRNQHSRDSINRRKYLF